ncbi:unnamed protein product [Bemisia tabaci]|uniref:Uncharacterized protein n=1 Tax=Bemisia tabaci TaxID=7038 RepID=A0A9P0AAS2_BEMTA|nr:unnamed protein product [Bemisia tabaci]
MSEQMDLVCCLLLLFSIANGLEISGTTANVDRELIFDITDTQLDVHLPSNLQPQSGATHFLSDTPDQQQLATRSGLKAVGTFVKTLSRKMTGFPRKGKRSKSRGGSFVSRGGSFASRGSFGRQDSSRDVGSSSRRHGAVRRPPKRELSHSEKYGPPGGYNKQMVHYDENDIPSPRTQRQLEKGPSEEELRKQFGPEGGYPRPMVQKPSEEELRRRFGPEGGYPRPMVRYDEKGSK